MPTARGAEDQRTRGLEASNALIAALCERDGVDTRAYGFMVRKAGASSVALHPGLHPRELALTEADDRDDPRRSRAEVGLTLGGSPTTSLRRTIEERHARLVHLHRWTETLVGGRPRAADMAWDPVLLALLRSHGADLDEIASAGPTSFANPEGRRDRPTTETTVTAPHDDGTPYLGIVDGDHVRVEQIRYAPGVFYVWRRRRPDLVELACKGHAIPDSVLNGIVGSPMSAAVGHVSLSATIIGGYSARGDEIVFKAPSTLSPA